MCLTVRYLVLKSLKASAILTRTLKGRRVATVANCPLYRMENQLPVVRDEANLKTLWTYNGMSAQRQPPNLPWGERGQRKCADLSLDADRDSTSATIAHALYDKLVV
jgi:hypothetical protein